jgi:hypothetical protein
MKRKTSAKIHSSESAAPKKLKVCHDSTESHEFLFYIAGIKVAGEGNRIKEPAESWSLFD